MNSKTKNELLDELQVYDNLLSFNKYQKIGRKELSKIYNTTVYGNLLKENGLFAFGSFSYGDIIVSHILLSNEKDPKTNKHKTFYNFIKLPIFSFCMEYLNTKKIPYSNRNVFEIILGEKYQKLYFDIDIKVDNNTDFNEAFIFLNELILTIIKCSNYQILQTDIFICNSHSSKDKLEKLSYHIIIQNWYVIDNIQNKIFCNLVYNNLSHPWKEHIDRSIYKNIQNFRCIFSCKNESNRYKYPDNLSPFKVSNEDPKIKDFLELKASLVTLVPECNLLHIKEFSENNIPKILHNNLEVNDILIETFLNYQETIGNSRDCFGETNTTGFYIYFKHLQPYYCKLCNDVHHNLPASFSYNPKSKIMFLQCKECKDKKYIFIKKIDNKDEDDDYEEEGDDDETRTTIETISSVEKEFEFDIEYINKCKNLFEPKIIKEYQKYIGYIYNTKTNNFDKIQKSQEVFETSNIQNLNYNLTYKNNSFIKYYTYCRKSCNQIITNKNYKIQVLQSAKGTFKTGRIQNFLNDFQDESVILFSCRVSFSNYMKGIYKNFDNYIDKNYTKCSKNNKIIFSCESLYKNPIDKYDIVIIDEVNLFIQAFNSDFNKNLIENRNKFIKILQNAKFIIILDALIPPIIFDILHKFLPNDNIYFSKNTFFQNCDVVYYKTPFNQMIIEMIECIKNKKPIQICVGSVALGDNLKVIFQNLDLDYKPTIIYLKANGDDFGYLLSNVNENLKCDILITTSVVAVSLSFTESHFYTRFVFGNNMTCDVNLLNQLEWRVRNLIDKKVYYNHQIVRNYSGLNYFIDPIKLVDHINEQINYSNSLSSEIFYKYDINTNNKNFVKSIEYPDNIWIKLYIDSKIYENKSRMFYYSQYERYLDENGYKIIFNYNDEDFDNDIKNFRSVKKHAKLLEAKKIKSEEYLKLIKEVQLINKTEYQEILIKKIKGYASENDKLYLKIADIKDEYLKSDIGIVDEEIMKKLINNIHTVVRYLFLINLNDIQLFYNDLYNNKEKVVQFFNCGKYSIIKDLITYLGFLDFEDQTTIIENKNVLDVSEWLIDNFEGMNIQFGINFKNKNDLKYDCENQMQNIKKLINSLLGYVGLKLENVSMTKPRNENGKQIRNYKMKLYFKDNDFNIMLDIVDEEKIIKKFNDKNIDEKIIQILK
jgi:hypothetical protein